MFRIQKYMVSNFQNMLIVLFIRQEEKNSTEPEENKFVSSDSEQDDSSMNSLIAPNYDASSPDESLIVKRH